MALILPIVEFKPEGGAWTDCTEDVLRDAGIEISGYGLPGSGPADRVAETNVCQLAMLNTEGNSGGVQGYYSPRNANLRPGFAKEAGLRVSIAVDADGWCDSEWSATWTDTVATVSPEFTGKIKKIDPDPGQYSAIASHIEARDFMDDLARDRMAAFDIEQGINESQAIEVIHDGIVATPFESLEAGQGPDSYAYCFDRTREETSPVTEINRVCQSSYGSYYIKPNGAPKYEPRNEVRAVAGASLTTTIDFDEDDLRVERWPEIEESSPATVTKVYVTMTPREVDSDTDEIVFQLKDAIPFEPGVVTIFTAPYTDPEEGSIQIGAVDLNPLVSGTDYAFNTEEDGSGTNETSNVVVTASFYGGSVNFSIDTTAISATVYPVSPSSPGPSAVLLQAEGVAIRAKDPITFEAGSGSNAITLDLPYQSYPPVAQALATWFEDTLSDDEPILRLLPLRLDKSDSARSIEILGLEVSDAFSVTETVTGLTTANKFWVNRKSWSIEGSGAIWCNILPAPADVGFEVEFGTEHLTTGGTQRSPATSFTTSSILPLPEALVLAWVESKRSGAVNPGIPALSGCNLTWVQVATNAYDSGGDARRRLTLFRGMGTIADPPTQGKVTIDDFGGVDEEQDRATWTIAQFSEVDTGGTHGSAAVVQSATASNNNVGSLTATLAAFSSVDNRPVGLCCCSASDSLTFESGWTKIGSRSSFTSMLSAWKEDGTDTTFTVTIPGASGNVGSIAVEIKKA